MSLTPQTLQIDTEGPSERSEGAGALGVEVTEEMVEAGVRVLWGDTPAPPFVREQVAAVYRAMAALHRDVS